MQAKDEILSKEIQKKVKELNDLFGDAVKDNGLYIDLDTYTVNVFPYRERMQRLVCKIYKEVL